MKRVLVLLLKIGLVLFALVILAAVAFIAYVVWEKRQYSQLTDTHDLPQRIEVMAKEYLAKRPQGALVIGVVQRGQRHFAGFGRAQPDQEGAPDGDTIFEIGSVTKVFTTLVLYQMAEAGDIKLDDRIRAHLPAEVKLPQELEPITLAQLAAHTAGLPRLPDNLDLSAANEANPYVNYHAENLHRCLAQTKLNRAPGKTAEYSNYGAGLLGHLLALKSGQSYEQLVRSRLCEPLGMADTFMALPPPHKERLSPGHNRKGEVIPNWDFGVLAPAGALKSSANDMLKFIEANLGADRVPSRKWLAESHRTRKDVCGIDEPLGWQTTVMIRGDLDILWHNGATGGYVSFLGLDLQNQTGVIVISNYGDAFAGDSSVDKMGLKILTLASKISLAVGGGN